MTVMMSCIGDDAAGKRITELCQQDGVVAKCPAQRDFGVEHVAVLLALCATSLGNVKLRIKES